VSSFAQRARACASAGAKSWAGELASTFSSRSVPMKHQGQTSSAYTSITIGVAAGSTGVDARHPTSNSTVNRPARNAPITA
jgi:hypothetical protein